MKIKHSNVKPIPAQWEIVVDRYLGYLRVCGRPRETIRTRREHLHFLARTIGLPPNEVNVNDLLQWCSERDWAPETRRGRYNTFRMFWRWAAEYTDLNDIADCLPTIRQTKGLANPVPDDEYSAALAAADDRTRRILRLGAEYGLRRREITLVQIPTDLVRDLVGWSLIVHGKGNKDRLVPLEDDMAYELLSLEAGYMLPGNVEGHLSIAYVGRLASRALPGVWTLHKLRHRFATKGYRATGDLYGLQLLLGHASSDTTVGYILPGVDQLRTIVRGVAKS